MVNKLNDISQLPGAWSVYMVFNRTTGRIYVGQASNVRRRCSSHLAELRRGTHPNCKMQWDATLHGADEFVCVALASQSEPDMIEALGAADIEHGYNRSDRDGWTHETSFREHEARLVTKHLYERLPAVERGTPVMRSMVAAWSRGMVGLSDRRRQEPLVERSARRSLCLY